MKRVEKILIPRVSTSDFAARTLADSIRNPEKGIHTKVLVKGLNAFHDYFVVRVIYDNTPENQNLINSLSANQPLQPREENNVLAKANKAQRASIYRKWLQNDQGKTYREFRKTVQQGIDCLMVQWCGMWLGIEDDGHTHS